MSISVTAINVQGHSILVLKNQVQRYRL